MKKTRKTEMKIGFLFATLVITIGGGSLMAQVTPYSTTWEGSFEADAFPADPNSWYTQGNLPITGTIIDDGTGNNYIHNGPTGDYEAVRNMNYVANYWTNGGASFEFRARVLGGGAYVSGLGHIITTTEVGDTHYYWLTYYIHTGEIEIYNSNHQAPGQGDVSLDVSEWHTYRFTIDPCDPEGPTWNLYIDNDPERRAFLKAEPYDGEGIPYAGYLGYFWGPVATADLDYMRYTDHGALPPLGEPPVTDCYIDLEDFTYIVNEWLVCTDPANSNCDQYWK